MKKIKRKGLSKRQSKKTFKKGNKTRTLNIKPLIQRGGVRL